MVRPAGFEPASPRLKGEHPGPLDEGRFLVRAVRIELTRLGWNQARTPVRHARIDLAES